MTSLELDVKKKLEAPYFEHMRRITRQLRAQPTLLLELESESFGEFACTKCGECCLLPWQIHISKEYYDAWSGVFAAHPSGRFADAFQILAKPSKDVYAGIARQPGGYRCVFLEPDNSCYIHNEHGPEALSVVCTEYPRMHKPMANYYSSYQLMNSCQAVPELMSRFPGLCYRFRRMPSPQPLIQPELIPDYPGRMESYLLIGLMLDLLELPQPESQIAKWRLFLPALEWMDGLGMSKLTETDLVRIRQDLGDRAGFAGLDLPDPDQQRRALQWTRVFLTDHTGSETWLKERLAKQDWPELGENEKRLLDHYLGLYLRSRILGMPYWDFFVGKLTLWQQMLLLAIQLAALQVLALYFSRNQNLPLSEQHLQRAINVVGFRLEQRKELAEELQFKNLEASQCYSGIAILLSLDFAGLGVWNL